MHLGLGPEGKPGTPNIMISRWVYPERASPKYTFIRVLPPLVAQKQTKDGP